jgi:flagellar basal body P-ring protein FlgI
MPIDRPRSTLLARLLSRRTAATALVLATAATHPGCDTVERLPDTPAPERIQRVSRADIPRIMRGTVGSEVVIDGFTPVLVRGYGLVVGLDGTGCTTLPPDLREYMTREMERRGVGSTRSGMGDLSPDRMLAAADTAVVIVEGLIPPGAVAAQPAAMGGHPATGFDVRVYLHPDTDATSLDGGRLFTCELRPVTTPDRLPPTGSMQAASMAEARGEVFVNPFAAPGTAVGDSVDRTRGRILLGGEATVDLPLKLRLLTPSHARAEIITAAINTRFPREPGMRSETAVGETGESIRINVPVSWRSDPDRFIDTLRHMTIRQTNPESVAASVGRIVTQDPGYGGTAMARWHALGPRALPVIREYYDAPNLPVRSAALEAGARLGDALVVPPLLRMLRSDSADDRRDAVRLLREPVEDPRIEFSLLEALDDEDLEVRLSAYEGLNARNSLLLDRSMVGEDFLLDVVESRYPMLYVAQVGRPRIVVFGSDLELGAPLPVEVWSGRMILKEMLEEPEMLEIFYRPRAGAPAELHESPRGVRELIIRLGGDRTMRTRDPGLGLTYAEILGALYELRRAGTLDADFKAEQDRVQAAIARAMSDMPDRGPRPDFLDQPEPATADPMFIDVGGGASDGGSGAAATEAPAAAPPAATPGTRPDF